MMDNRQDAEKGLLAYTIGWRKGAVGGAATPYMLANPDFAKGYEDGRIASKAMYSTACKEYGVVLSVLREP